MTNRQQADNSFNEGLNLDINPIAVSNNTLTNCLNGTMITYNGNEHILQNDMGNGRVHTAKLPAGYVPLGIKEHGGIIYVASKNPITGKCQIGSFPSPQQQYVIDSDNNATRINIRNFTKDGEIITTSYNTLLWKDIRPNDQFSIDVTLPCSEDGINYSLGVKGKNEGITKLDKKYEEGKPYYYDESTSGDLYLMGQLDVIEDFSIGLKGISSDNGSHTLTFTYEYNTSATDDPFSTITFTPTNNTTVNTEDKTITVSGIEDNIYSYTATPKLKYSNTDYEYTDLSIKGTVDIVAESSDEVSLTNWRYYYNNTNNSVRLTYGFSGAMNVKKVNFTFYRFNDNDNSSTFVQEGSTIPATSRTSYSGIFQQTIKNLTKNSLYLVKIECEKSEDTDTFYKWLWTNDIRNNLNGSSQTDWDGTINTLTPINDFTVNESGVNDFKINGDKSNKISTSSNTIFQYNYVNEKTVQIDVSDQISIKEANKLPFAKSWYEQITGNTSVTGDVTNKQHDTLYKTNGSTIDVSSSTRSTYENSTLTMSADFNFRANSQSKQGLVTFKLLQPYLRKDDDKYLDEDLRKIYGYKSSDTINYKFPKYGLCMQMGQYSADDFWETSKIYTSYRISTFADDASIEVLDKGSNLASDGKITGTDATNADRAWKEVMIPKINKKLLDHLDYVPPIFFISCWDKDYTAVEYGETAMTQKLVKKTGDSHEKYSLALWRNYSDNNYYIINQGFYLDDNNTSNAYTALNELFSELYIADNSTSTIDKVYYVADNTNYNYTSKNDHSCDLVLNITTQYSTANDNIMNNETLITALQKLFTNGIPDNLSSSNDIKFRIQSSSTGVWKKSYKLETPYEEIADLINSYFTAAESDRVYGVGYIDGNNVITTCDNKDLREDKIYYFDSNKKIKDLETSNDSVLGTLKGNLVIVDKIKPNGQKIRVIVLKDGTEKMSSTSSNMPYIGVGSKPFSFVYSYSDSYDPNYESVVNLKISQDSNAFELWT